MVWDIGSTLTSKQPVGHQFHALRNRLLLYYLLIITIILGTFSVAVYMLVARDRNQQLNSYLQQVAATAASSLEIIQHEYMEFGPDQDDEDDWDDTNENGEDDEDEDEDEDEDDEKITPALGNPPLNLGQLMDHYTPRSNPESAESTTPINNNSPTAIVSNPLSFSDQGIEWFDAQGHLMVQEGALFTHLPLPTAIPLEGQFEQDKHIRSFAQVIYRDPLARSPQILGYVRASESTLQLEQELRRLQGRLALGVIIVSGLITVGGMWLTRESMQPVLTSFEQLKQFTSDASHELRNPLTAIRASIAVMQSHPERIHPDDVTKIKAIASASAQMSTLVDDLLLLARMDRDAPNQRTWRRIPIDEILDDLVNLYSDRAQQANISLYSHLEESLEVTGDASQLQRLFTNLLSNALQYTSAEGTVTVSLEQQGAYGLVKIEDTGIGIAPDQVPYLFDRFWRADRARHHHEGGTGLGLAIAQAIAQRHSGKITVQSQLGVGSCFQVKIPLA